MPPYQVDQRLFSLLTVKVKKSLTNYIGQMYTYLSRLVSEAVFYIQHEEVDSIEEAYACLVENFKTFMELLEVQDQVLVEKALISGIISCKENR